MIAATFHGPKHFAPSHDESTIEVFDNIGHAISVLFDRFERASWPQPVRYLNGNHRNVIFPFTDLGSYFECYRIDSLDGSIPPGEGAIEDALCAVHGGAWDYRLTLTQSTEGTLSISIAKG